MIDLFWFIFIFLKFYSVLPVWKKYIILLASQVLIFFILAKFPATMNPMPPFIQNQGNHLFKHVILNRSKILPLTDSQSKSSTLHFIPLSLQIGYLILI